MFRLSESDCKNVLFISIHGCGFDEDACRFYPGGGYLSSKLLCKGVGNTSEKDEMYPGGILNLPMPFNATRPQWRDTLRSRAFPRISEFRPDIIFISAGFDSHEKDNVGCGFGKFIEFDFSWITKELQRLANLHCEGRIVSVLEGGYNLRGGLLSPLAQSVSFHTAELRSRSRECYKEPTPKELEQLAEIDQKMEEERQKNNEIEEQEYFKRSKRMCSGNSTGRNDGELLTELIAEDAPAEYLDESNLNKGEEAKNSEHAEELEGSRVFLQ